MTRPIAIALLALTLLGCGGTYVDEKHNFERALKMQRPKDVQVLHSIYWQSPHFTRVFSFEGSKVEGIEGESWVGLEPLANDRD